ncbi:MAG: protein kinase, partial [Nitriliruptorales bacterium]|nr:protein kinase [Nitriliruptorales bacterium]
MTDQRGTQDRVLAGRYRLLREIGRGGMAEVWAAEDEVLDREVAVKLLSRRFANDQHFIERFRDEARHAASLNHPNVVAVFDTGDHGGLPFIVMELVQGRSLQEAIAAGGLTEQRALEVCAEVCAALQFAHERGLVHRDIKPGNILLAEDGSVKVT